MQHQGKSDLKTSNGLFELSLLFLSCILKWKQYWKTHLEVWIKTYSALLITEICFISCANLWFIHTWRSNVFISITHSFLIYAEPLSIYNNEIYDSNNLHYSHIYSTYLKYSDSCAQVQSVSQKTSMGTFAYSFYLLTAQALALWMFDNIV